MIKLVLYILIIVAASGAGLLKAKAYENRVFHLQDFISTLKILESDMKYLLDPLPVIFDRIGKIKKGLTGKLFMTTCEMIRKDSSQGFSGYWEEAVFSVYKESSLTREDKQIIADFGINIGKTDMGSQINLFSRTCDLLEDQVKEAIEERSTKGKMYKSLGAALGIMVVIILV